MMISWPWFGFGCIIGVLLVIGLTVDTFHFDDEDEL
jgi:hypothetical protein